MDKNNTGSMLTAKEQMAIQKKVRLETTAKLIGSQEGRKILASSFLENIKEKPLYQSLVKEVLQYQPAVQTPIFLKRFKEDIECFVINSETKIPNQVLGREPKISVPLFYLGGSVTISLADIQDKNIDLKDDFKDVVLNGVYKKEDELILDLIAKSYEQVVETNPTLVVNKESELNIDSISEGIKILERNGLGLTAKNIIINPGHAKIFREIPSKYNFFTPELSEELYKQGKIGTLWSSNIITSVVCPLDEIYILCDPEYLGRFVQAHDLSILPFDASENLSTGFRIFERIGLLISNSKGIAKIKITNLGQ